MPPLRHVFRPALLAACLVSIVVLASAPTAQARNVCNHVNRFDGRTTWWNHAVPPLLLGDSTMLLSARLTGKLGFDVNARACRQLPDAVDMLRDARRAGTLPPMVVLFLGANGSIEGHDLEAARRVVGPARVLVVVTPLEKGGGAGADAAAVREFAHRHRAQNVRLLDWVDYSRGHPSWFYEDRLHPTDFPGAGQLSRFISRASRWYPSAPACGPATATRLAGTAADVPLCGDFTGDRAPDMVVPMRSGEPVEVRGFDLYVQHGVQWRMAVSDSGALLGPLGAEPPYLLRRHGPHGLVVDATGPGECDGCPLRPRSYTLGWRPSHFVVLASHPA